LTHSATLFVVTLNWSAAAAFVRPPSIALRAIALRDRVHRFNASGRAGLLDNWTEDPKSRWSEA